MKKVRYLFLVLLAFIFLPCLVSAKDVFYSPEVVFPLEYDLVDTSKNVVSSELEGTISYAWIKLQGTGSEAILADLYLNCDTVEKSHFENCTSTITQAGSLIPSSFTPTVGNNFSKNDLTSGDWLVWASINTLEAEYRSYKVYNIEITEKDTDKDELAPEPPIEETTKPDSSTSQTDKKTYSNPDTGIYSWTFIIVPIILGLGIIISFKKFKYED